MKKIYTVLAIALLFMLPSCREMFETDPDNIINESDYISGDDEMYKGFLGIMTRLQQAADHSIILTDTRGDMLDVTSNAPLDLQKIYTYDDTDGNPYADPSPYYAIIVACNDYVDRMTSYQKRVGNQMDDNAALHFKQLISSSLRLKVWAYLKLLSIYGESIWFDDPLQEKIDLSDATIFTHCDVRETVEKCLNLLDKGITINGVAISSQLDMDWAAWINEEEVTTNYDHWRFMVPPYFSLKCELLLWRGNEEDYRWVRDNVVDYLYRIQMGLLDDGIDVAYSDWRFACNIPIRTGADNLYATEYYRTFFNELYNASNFTNFYQVVTGVMYDYENNQTNRIVEYFCPVTPGKYYLKPSHRALTKYNTSDLRGVTQRNNMCELNGDTCVCKYYYHRGDWLRTRIVEIHPALPLFRGHDYHFWLSEAENHLHQWHQSECIINKGVTNEFADKILPDYWSPKYQSWFCESGGYGDIGVSYCVYGDQHDFPVRYINPVDKTSDGTGPFYNSLGKEFNEQERMREYDLLIMDEAMNEYAFEGRAYSFLCRMADRYPEAREEIAERIAVKYEGTPYYDKVKSSIMNGGYWVKWDLKADDLKK